MTELPRPEGGAPLWSRPRARELGAPLSGPVRADVAVVGGGITGLTLALLLQREGLSVALLEAERVASGMRAWSSSVARITGSATTIRSNATRLSSDTRVSGSPTRARSSRSIATAAAGSTRSRRCAPTWDASFAGTPRSARGTVRVTAGASARLETCNRVRRCATSRVAAFRGIFPEAARGADLAGVGRWASVHAPEPLTPGAGAIL